MSVDSFRAAIVGGLARSNQFQVDLSFPSSVVGGSIAAQVGQFMCKATSLPSSTIQKASAFYKGREVKLGGEREFEDWTVTIYNDSNFMLRNAFEKWSNSINNNVDNSGILRPSDYMTDMSVTQLDRNGNQLKKYKMVGAWPVTVANIDLDMEGGNIETFVVTLAIQRWESDTSTTGSMFGINASIDTPIGSFGV